MKKFVFGMALIACCGLLFAGCSSDNTNDDPNRVSVPVTVRMDGFEVSQTEFPTHRAEAVSSYTTITYLTLAFYDSEGTEVFKQTQHRGDATTYTTFGEFSTRLYHGNYTMLVIGNAGSNAVTLTSPTSAGFPDSNGRITFVNKQNVVVSGSSVQFTGTLERVNTAIVVNTTDTRTANVAKLRITTAGGSKLFNPSTGLATDDEGVATEIVNSLPAVGQTVYTGAYLFITTDPENTNVTIETLDAEDNVLITKTIPNVPLKRNRITELRGALFSAAASAGSFQVNTDLLPSEVIDF